MPCVELNEISIAVCLLDSSSILACMWFFEVTQTALVLFERGLYKFVNVTVEIIDIM